MLLPRETRITNGNVADFGDYKNVVGECTGLKLAINEIDILSKNIEKANED